jgi:uncharacterized protein YbjT (DUF2867 family)
MKKAILFGASGFIGSYILQNLLTNDDYEQVSIVVRKDPQIKHPKLITLIGDLNALPLLKKDIVADDVFIALGTTKKNTPDEKEYYKIDHDYPVMAAKLAKENGAKSVLVVSSIGADVNSTIFYTKTKGEMERDITALNYEHTHIFQPSMLLGNRKENRPLEKLFINIFRIISPIFIGKSNKYRGIEGMDVAKAMIKASRDLSVKVKTYHWQEMQSLMQNS